MNSSSFPQEIIKKPTTPRTQKSVEGSVNTGCCFCNECPIITDEIILIKQLSVIAESKQKSKAANSKQNASAKARDEARKRLMAAKKAMRGRRNSESEDVIYVS